MFRSGRDNIDEQLLTDEQVARAYCVSRTTVWNWVKSGSIPRPVKVGRRSRWIKSEIVEHIHNLDRVEALEAAS
jgi:predicted DNA-binding transcriptional regulator AlpA